MGLRPPAIWTGRLEFDLLRGWFANPREPLAVDDVEFCLLGTDLCFKIDGSIPYVLPEWLTLQLAAYV